MTHETSAVRQEQLRIQALGAAISRRDWHATERAYEAIRDAFDKDLRLFVSAFTDGEQAREVKS